MNPLHIGFIGTGRIARAIIGGLSKREQTVIFGFDKQSETLDALTHEYPLHACTSEHDVAQRSHVVILAVKPYQVAEVLAELKPVLTTNHLVISVAAGISTDFIQTNCINGIKVIRVMPNTPVMVGKGMTALTRGAMVTDDDLALAVELFNAVGKTVVLDEPLMDGATALSGSGPAYMFNMLDAFARGGEDCGLTYNDALLLAAQTMIGAATMALSSPKSPEELKREVTTPGGTTEAGLKVMESQQLQKTLREAVIAAATRSKELMK